MMIRKFLIALIFISGIVNADMIGGQTVSAGGFAIYPASSTIIAPSGIDARSTNFSTNPNSAAISGGGNGAIVGGATGAGIYGTCGASGNNSVCYGIQGLAGQNISSGAKGFGVYGQANANGFGGDFPNSAAGVFGEMTPGNDVNSIGVRAHASSSKSAGGGPSNYGVYSVADGSGAGATANVAYYATAQNGTGSGGNYAMFCNAGDFHLPAYSLASLQAKAPTNAGDLVYCNNCTNTPTCISTGTTTGAWSSPAAKGTACN